MKLERALISWLLAFAVVVAGSPARAQVVVDMNVRLVPVIEHVDLATDLNVVGETKIAVSRRTVVDPNTFRTNPRVQLSLEAQDEQIGRAHV